MHNLQYIIYEWHTDPWYFLETCSTIFEKRMESLDFVIDGIESTEGPREEQDLTVGNHIFDAW